MEASWDCRREPFPAQQLVAGDQFEGLGLGGCVKELRLSYRSMGI